MDLCSKGHDEVCYDGGNCPACQIMLELSDEIANKDDEIKDLDKQITQLNKEIEGLNNAE